MKNSYYYLVCAIILTYFDFRYSLKCHFVKILFSLSILKDHDIQPCNYDIKHKLYEIVPRENEDYFRVVPQISKPKISVCWVYQ